VSGLRELPSVDEVARKLQHLGLPHDLIVSEARSAIAKARSDLKDGRALATNIEAEIEDRLKQLSSPSLRPVINATGVILHTNLGRAPLSEFCPIAGYSNLEYDLQTGKRGKRDAHTGALLKALIGRDAIVVNNNASAVFLVLHELAAEYEVIVSRGELIEIGDGFRIPEIMSRSGAILREVGTTNRTNIGDYRDAVNTRTKAILRVHPSNFHVSGFTSRPTLAELSQLGCEVGIPVYEDLGSGCLADIRTANVNEPLVTDSIGAGVNVISFSCDKLLGGPQSGIIAGDAALVARIRRNPMYRAFRVDKLVIEALETTLRHLLRHEWDAIPTLRMILASAEELRQRAERVASSITGAAVRAGESPIGGGSTPDQTLPTWLVELSPADPVRFEAALRAASRPVIARIEKQKVLLDMRTVSDSEVPLLIEAVRAV
jgi:L-seryl-tRNA(Ser) seleniumtransferase